MYHNDLKPTLTDRNKRILEFLRSRRLGVLSTVDVAGKPHASVIYFDVDGSFIITFLTKARTEKTQNLKRMPYAQLTVFDEYSQTTVQIEGDVAELTDSKTVNRVFRNTLQASLSTSDTGIPPIAKLNAGNFIAFELRPQDVRMAVYSRPDHGDYERIFETADLQDRV